MQEKNLFGAFALMVFIVAVTITGWELHLRSTGIPLAYDDGKELWSNKRARVYDPPEKTTVFIGSSRIKFDLDIDTWEKLTGREAVQLAEVGSSPMPILEDLGNDPKFHGRLVVDVTEPLFFSKAPPVTAKPDAYVAYYAHETPAQKASFAIDRTLESQLLFLDRDAFSLNAMLDDIRFTNRPGVFVFPTFPIDFGRTTVDRQEKMTPRFLLDTAMQDSVKDIWVFLQKVGRSAAGPNENPVPGVIRTAALAVSKIRARGGEVVFTRTPDSAPVPGGEQTIFPRRVMWEPLLAATHSQGFYFTDNPATAHFVCPEWSHLSPPDAVLYTRALVAELPAAFAH